MSVVTVTELPDGSLATSSGVNATIASFNTATAAGALTSGNFRTEGIDRRSMSKSANVVEADTSAEDFFESAPSVATSNTTGLYVVISLDGGAAPMRTGSTTFPAGATVLLHASVHVVKEPIAATASLPRVWLYVMQSTDGGATYSVITGTERILRMRDTTTLCDPTAVVSIPGIDQTVSWSLYVGTTGVATIYQVAFKTEFVGQLFTFSDGIITLEALLE